MKLYPRGSEWRKWDLHVHAPGTKMNDDYGTPAPWDEFCRIIEESDVDVVAITDYFSFDGFFAFLQAHNDRYPKSQKVFFPNLELRLTETVNRAQEEVHMHLLFRPELTSDEANRFLAALKLEQTEASGRYRTCDQLQTQQYRSATVSRASIRDAIKDVFGPEPHADDSVLRIVPANNDGIRARESHRKRQLADEIDKDCHALFGNPGNCGHYLNTGRFEEDELAVAKPVFAGSDAHSIKELKDWLGKTVADGNQFKHTTWIKADPTFEGLQQTLVEPAARVRLQSTRPDAKEPYKVISSVTFEGTEDFPEEIVFNQNLVSVIGSRSAGKSALLAYIAHAVEPEATLREQLAMAPHGTKIEKLGPGAGVAWSDVKDIKCTVHWGSSGERIGQVIYIPQNSLHAISQRPDEITEKIEPTVFRLDPAFQRACESAAAEIEDANANVREATARWFDLSDQLATAKLQLREIGDREAIEQTRAGIASKIEQLRRASSLSEQESTAYQQLTDRLAEIEARTGTIAQEARQLSAFLTENNDEQGTTAYKLSPAVRVNLTTTPDVAALPDELESRIRELLATAKQKVISDIEGLLIEHRAATEREEESLSQEQGKLRERNATLIEKHSQNAEIDTLLKSKQKQDQALKEIEQQEKRIKQLTSARKDRIKLIVADLGRRAKALDAVKNAFNHKEHCLDRMSFGREQEREPEQLRALAERFN